MGGGGGRMKSRSRAADVIKEHEGVKSSKGDKMEAVGVRVDHMWDAGHEREGREGLGSLCLEDRAV